jgi:hypothetical protein
MPCDRRLAVGRVDEAVGRCQLEEIFLAVRQSNGTTSVENDSN